MSNQLLHLARPEILSLRAYASARSLFTAGAQEAESEFTYLDANEAPSPGGSSPDYYRYPEPQPRALVRRLAGIYGLEPASFLIGRGSDEAIDLLTRAFCRSGQDSILICPPTYGVYEIAAQIQGASVVRVPLKLKGETTLDESAIEQALATPGSTIKLIYLCSPNNPTGTAFESAALSRICAAASGRALVVVDEAYAEFSQEQSMLSRLAQFPNLLVLRTLSKAWALAGLRVGIVAGAPELIGLLQKVRAPYPLNAPGIAAALDGTGPEAQSRLSERISSVREERERLARCLRELPEVLEIFPSAANFLLVRFRDAGQVMARSRQAGIILRDRSHEEGLGGCVRITIGTPKENLRLLSVLSELGVRP